MKVAIIGSGSMGSGIAQVVAAAGHTVLLYDNNPQALARAQEQLKDTYKRLVEKGKVPAGEADAVLSRIQFIGTLFDCKGAALVIEAIIEDLGAKRSLFEQVEEAVDFDCVLASNTSSLSLAAIAAACRRPERVIGVHFFNPAPLMRLVEIVPAVQTRKEVLQKVRGWVDSWGKTTVVVQDTPGFIVNRLARPFYGEALRLLEEGVADAATIDWAMTELGGFRMGPFALMDFIGNDINYTVTETVFQAFYFDPRYRPSLTQKRLVEAGYLGRKSGRGFYDYRPEATPPQPLKDQELGRHILERILVMLINEAAEACLLRIASPDDLDLAMTSGVNYPKGLLQWADELGIDRCVEVLDSLYEEYREDRYRCSVLLRRMARENRRFYPLTE